MEKKIIYLHIGTNKTASSFLQSSLLHNQKALLSKGFFIPDSPWDKDMRSGMITPGNGHELAKLLATGDEKKLAKYLKLLLNLADANKAYKIILSNEVIIRILSYREKLDLLCGECSKLKISLKCLCYLRHPLSHALSLYKHRAKSGKYPDYDEWLEKDYETLRLFEKFLIHYRDYDIDWNFKLYKSDSGYLMNIFYEGFLQADVYDSTFQTSVNKSLTLKHIWLLQFYESRCRESHEFLYKELIKLNSSPEQTELYENFCQSFQHYMNDKNELLKNLSCLLTSKEEQVEFLRDTDINLENNFKEVVIHLSPKELKTIYSALEEYRKKKLILYVKSLYRFFKRKVKKNFDDKFSSMYGGSLR